MLPAELERLATHDDLHEPPVPRVATPLDVPGALEPAQQRRGRLARHPERSRQVARVHRSCVALRVQEDDQRPQVGHGDARALRGLGHPLVIGEGESTYLVDDGQRLASVGLVGDDLGSVHDDQTSGYLTE